MAGLDRGLDDGLDWGFIDEEPWQVGDNMEALDDGYANGVEEITSPPFRKKPRYTTDDEFKRAADNEGYSLGDDWRDWRHGYLQAYEDHCEE